MLSALIASVSISTYAVVDDVWVYPHASEQVNDAFLRVWGSDGRAVTAVDDASPASWSLLQFKVGADAATKTPKSAKLVLHHVPKLSFSDDDSVAGPIEVRPVKAGFSEKTWVLEQSSKHYPALDGQEVYGFKSIKATTDEKPIEVEIDLMSAKSTFANSLKSVDSSGLIAMALASKMEIQGGSGGHIYKFYSKSADEKLRPKLVIEW